MKYSNNFNRDFNWYLQMRHQFNFSGKDEKVVYDKDGIDGKKAFLLLDSQGKLKPTRHPNLLKALLKTKGSINLHIKMYAEDRANGRLPKMLFQKEIIDIIKPPQWFVNAVEQQKYKYYE
jgi:hypothetical protein